MTIDQLPALPLAVAAPCQSSADYYGQQTCQTEPTQVVLAGCVHEHVMRRLWCRDCVARAVQGTVYCGHCAQVDGHRCPLFLVGDVPAGEVRALAESHGWPLIVGEAA